MKQDLPPLLEDRPVVVKIEIDRELVHALIEYARRQQEEKSGRVGTCSPDPTDPNISGGGAK